MRKTRKLLNGKRLTWAYAWNAEDQLTEAVTPSGEHWRYTYDPLGRRTAKLRLADDGSVAERTDFTWDDTRLAEQRRPDGTVTTWEYAPDTHLPLTQTDHRPLVREPGGSLLTKLAQDTSADFRTRFHAIVTDTVGTPVELVTPDAELAWQGRTTLWGTDLPAPTPASSVDCPLRFPGQYADAETGLNYNYFRYYDPEIARYLTTDPLGLEPAPNPVAYVQNPQTRSDPLGLAPYDIHASVAYQDWGTKGAHIHIGKNEVRIFPDDKGGIGAEPIRLKTGTASDREVQKVLDEIRNNKSLRDDIIDKATSARDSMNRDEFGMAKNRAPEIHFLIKNLQKMNKAEGG